MYIQKKKTEKNCRYKMNNIHYEYFHWIYLSLQTDKSHSCLDETLSKKTPLPCSVPASTSCTEHKVATVDTMVPMATSDCRPCSISCETTGCMVGIMLCWRLCGTRITWLLGILGRSVRWQNTGFFWGFLFRGIMKLGWNTYQRKSAVLNHTPLTGSYTKLHIWS